MENWRVEVMHQQIPEHGPIPLLYARPGTVAPPGYCWSCGDLLQFPKPGMRCDACTAAAREALAWGDVGPKVDRLPEVGWHTMGGS